jgi:hypothetical protein
MRPILLTACIKNACPFCALIFEFIAEESIMNQLLEIQDLEVGIAPCGASDAVTGFECLAVIAVIAIYIYYG